MGKLSFIWDTVGTVHLSPRDLPIERRQLDNMAIFERRRTTVNELAEKAPAGEVRRKIDIWA